MSSSDGGSDDTAPGTREVAHRIFAAEFDDADLEHSESDEERAPNYVVTPTGLRVNRLFAVGVLTEVESVNEQTLRGRVVDPTGAFVTYAGQYQPDEAAFLDRTTPPAFVALTGKARTFQPEDSDMVYTSVRPESLATVDAGTRDRWVVSAAAATLRRVAVFAEALVMEERGDRLRARLADAGVPAALAAGIPLAIDHYDTGHRYLEAARTLAVDALEVVADEREEVRALSVDPGERGGADLGPLPDVPYDFAGAAAPDPALDESASDGPTAGEVDAAASTASTVDESSARDPDEAAEPDPVESADATGADESGDDVAAAEADHGTDAEPEPVGSGAGDDLGEFDDADDDLGEFDDADDDLGEFDAGGTTDAGSQSGAADAADDAGGLDETDDLGEFDAGETTPEADPDADPEDFEDALSEEERREVEAEHGVEFSTGSEVPDAGESGIETPDPDADAADTGAADADPVGTADSATESDAGDDDPSTGAGATGSGNDEGEDGVTGATADEVAADVDLEDAVVDLMSDLDDGDGADREAVVAAAVERHGADPGAAEDAIQEALMSGKCYEPADGTLKPI